MFSHIFIERPRLAAVVSLVIFIAGALCMTKLSVEEYPQIAPPSINVSCNYTGCSAETVRDVIATQLDSEINGVEDMIYFSSTCSNDGRYNCSITFKTGVDDDIAMVNVQNAIKAAEAKLPSEVQRTGVRVRKRSSDMLGVFSFSTDESVMSSMQLNNYISTTVADAVSRVNGVSSADVMGGDVYSMRIWLDPLRMAGLGVKIGDISSAVQSQNIQAAAGTLGAEQGNEFLQFKINVQGRLKTAEEFGDIVIRSAADGSILRLKDIADVELGARSYTGRGVCDGKRACGLVVYRNNDSNALETMNGVKAVLKEMSERFPDGVTYVVANDPTKFILVTLREIVITIVVALALVILVTYVFLQDWRATLVPALAIPVALIGTFTFMYLMEYSINVLSMFGLILVIGSLVDDAIVVVENCQSLMLRERLSPKQAALKSMKQITGAIIATTLVTISCYVPLAFYGGMVGEIYMQFSVTMCIALILSTTVAMTLSPALCALILRPPSTVVPVVFKPFNWILDSFKRAYLACVNTLVKRAGLTIALFAGICLAIWGISQVVPGSFLPEEDKGMVMMNIELAPGASTVRTQATLERVRERIMRVAGVEGVMMMPGHSMMSGNGEHVAMGFVRLDSWDKRKTADLQLSSIVGKLQAGVADIPEANIVFFTPPAIMGLGAVGGVSAVLCGEGDVDAVEFSKIVKEVVAEINSWPTVRRASSAYNADTMQLELEIDRTKAETLGVPVGSIFSALQSQLASFYINDFNYAGDAFYVKMQAEKSFRVTQDDICSILVGNASGEMVPLSALATIHYMVGPTEIQRFNKLTSADISIQPANGVSSGEMMESLSKMTLPTGFHFEWKGQSYQERQNQGQLMIIMGLALLFAYFFLVAQYESWTIPMPVMLTVAVPILGAFVGLWLAGLSLSVYAQLGMVMLIGLSAKNAILMIEFSKQSHEAGYNIHDAALMGAGLRFRAVLMTAWSFLFGVFPLVIATGAGAGSRRAIGITTFSGMLLATLVGIMFAPALYSLFSRMRETVRKANVPAVLLDTPDEFKKYK
ncbi:MAG: efflux RND transporter permease subunit [Opitutales bacterium]|nr:efflux RND transporter permease subunit [Opitutales bacterium]